MKDILWLAVFKLTTRQAMFFLLALMVVVVIISCWGQIKELIWRLTGKWEKVRKQKREDIEPYIHYLDTYYDKHCVEKLEDAEEVIIENRSKIGKVFDKAKRVSDTIVKKVKKAPPVIKEKFRHKETLERFYNAKTEINQYVGFCDEHSLEYFLDKELLDNKIDAIWEKLDFDRWIERKLTVAKEEYDSISASVQKEGQILYDSKQAASKTVEHALHIINSMAKTPKEFEIQISQTVIEAKSFKELCRYGAEEAEKIGKGLKHGIEASAVTGTAIAVGGAPTAMWIATTFGKASTGVAISALKGAAASNAALAWLGGGAVAAGGGGIAAGSALLSLMGPIGFATGGSLTVISLVRAFWKKKKLQKEKKEEVYHIREWTGQLSRTKELICSQRIEIETCADGLKRVVDKCENLSKDYLSLKDSDKELIGQLVNTSNALACMITREIVYEE